MRTDFKEKGDFMINFRKAVMVGCGFVGSASVFALMQSGLFSEIAMIDADMDKAEGEAMVSLLQSTCAYMQEIMMM